MIRRLLVCALLAMGCATSPRPTIAPPIAPTTNTCIVGAASAAESIAVATTGPVNPAHAPQSANAAERFVFAQAYETLINVDCEGHAYPGLAASWTTDATKTRVTLTLRDGARFWNGDAIVARDVAAAWHNGAELARRLADGTTVVDDRTLTVSLPDTEWLVLATPALAVSRTRTGSRWPEGSGPYRLEESAMDVAPGRLALLPRDGRTAPRIMIRTTPGTDARDAIDGGADLIPSADPTAVRYAAARSDLATVPLPWLRTYVLAIPTGALSDVIPSAADSLETVRASLARDAVRAEARPAATTGWWSDIQGCESIHRTAMPGGIVRRPRIAYSADDHVAREIAERLVALGTRLAATPLGPADFARALSAGGDVAYVVNLPHSSLAPCHDVSGLVSSAPWLAAGGALVSLADTRERAILKRATISTAIDWDGTLRMSGTRPPP